MKSAGAPVEDQVLGHERRNVALIEKLVSMGVDLHNPRLVDLHFFLPTAEAARSLATGLELQAVQAVTIAESESGYEVTGFPSSRRAGG